MTSSLRRVCAIATITVATLALADIDPLLATRTSVEGTPAEPRKTLWSAPRPIDIDGGIASAVSFLRRATAEGLPDGDLPRDVVITPDGTTAIVVHRDTDNVAFINLNTRQVTHIVSVGDYPLHLAITPNGQHVIVPCPLSDKVYIVSVATHTVVAQVPVTGQQPYRAAVTANGHFAVVGVINDAITSALSIIDCSTWTEVRSIPTAPQGVIGFFFTPEVAITGELISQFSVSPDNTTVVLPDRGNAIVKIYDINAGAEVASLGTAFQPTAVDISNDGLVAVVSHESNAKTITRINLASRTVTDAFATVENLTEQRIRITTDKSHAIAAIANNVIFVNLGTGVTDATLFTGVVGDIELSFDGQYAFISNFNSSVIHIPTRAVVRTIPFASCYDAATSPTQYRAVALNNRFREDIHMYDINGSTAFFEGMTLTGPPPEGDSTRAVAVTPDGATAVAGNLSSHNVSIIDLPSRSVRAHVETGDRVFNVALTPDGLYAVSTNTDAHTVSVIDLNTDTRVANVPISNRPGEIRISPNGQWAYVTSIAGTDQLHFIELSGATSHKVSAINTGQMGSIGYTYSVLSGMEISPDGSLLALCISFDDQLMLVDAATRSEIARLPVGDFPIRVAFSQSGTKAYVANSFGDSINVINVAGASSSVAATIGPIEFPLTVNVDSTGDFVYVGSWDFTNPSIKVVSTASNSIVATVPLPDPPRAAVFVANSPAQPGGPVLAVATTDGELIFITATGPTSAVYDSIPTGAGPVDLVYSSRRRAFVMPQPFPDRLDLYLTVTPGDTNCDGSLNQFDITSFVQALASPNAYFGAYPACEIESADLNLDGTVNQFDIQPFLSCLIAAECP